MKVEKTNLEGVLLIKPEPVNKEAGTGEFFEDHRGLYIETYNEAEYKKHGIDVDFVQDDFSMSRKDVLRGIHGDNETYKLISCPFGEFYFVAVNCDKESPDFGKWQSFVLNETNHWQVLVPPKYGNGHLILSDKAIFNYKQSTYYDPSKQFSYKWDNPDFKIEWPTNAPILSKRDTEGKQEHEQNK